LPDCLELLELNKPNRFPELEPNQYRDSLLGHAYFIVAEERGRIVGSGGVLNEILGLAIKVELAFRALEVNYEICQMAGQRVHFVQALVGAKFDKFCEPLIKESADLSTIHSTARLQMDVGHVFKRYAEFHRRLAEMRHRLAEDLLEVTEEAVMNLLEKRLPGLNLGAAVGRDIKISISHPILNDTTGGMG